MILLKSVNNVNDGQGVGSPHAAHQPGFKCVPMLTSTAQRFVPSPPTHADPVMELSPFALAENTGTNHQTAAQPSPPQARSRPTSLKAWEAGRVSPARRRESMWTPPEQSLARSGHLGLWLLAASPSLPRNSSASHSMHCACKPKPACEDARCCPSAGGRLQYKDSFSYGWEVNRFLSLTFQPPRRKNCYIFVQNNNNF